MTPVFGGLRMIALQDVSVKRTGLGALGAGGREGKPPWGRPGGSQPRRAAARSAGRRRAASGAGNPEIAAPGRQPGQRKDVPADRPRDRVAGGGPALQLRAGELLRAGSLRIPGRPDASPLSAVIPSGSPSRRQGVSRPGAAPLPSAAMTTATTSRASSSSIGSSAPGRSWRSKVRFTARTAAGTSAGATGNGLCANPSRSAGSCRSAGRPNECPSR